jgi:hypothetical protein
MLSLTYFIISGKNMVTPGLLPNSRRETAAETAAFWFVVALDKLCAKRASTDIVPARKERTIANAIIKVKITRLKLSWLGLLIYTP